MQSEIESAIESLKKAILSEYNGLVKKHKVKNEKLLTDNERLRKAIDNAADILHNIPRIKNVESYLLVIEKIDKKIQKAWDILDHTTR